MEHHSDRIIIEHVGNMWRVCAAGICKEHRQEWQAKVFYHQMTASNPNVHAGD